MNVEELLKRLLAKSLCTIVTEPNSDANLVSNMQTKCKQYVNNLQVICLEFSSFSRKTHPDDLQKLLLHYCRIFFAEWNSKKRFAENRRKQLNECKSSKIKKAKNWSNIYTSNNIRVQFRLIITDYHEDYPLLNVY